MNDNSILVVLVAYQLDFRKSISYTTLCNKDEYNFLIYDNSPKSCIDKINDLAGNITYIHDPNNAGVSGAYNFAANYSKKNGYSWMLLLDQDTKFLPDSMARYQEAVYLCSKRSNVSIIAPLLFTKDSKIASPNKTCMGRYFHVNNIQTLKEYDLKRYSALNSGMLFRVSHFFDISGYDERLFYFSDHDVCNRLSLMNRTIFLSRVSGVHDASTGDNSLPKNVAFRSYSRLLDDGLIFYKKNNLYKKYGTLSILFSRGVRLSILFKTIKPLVFLIKRLING